jgi:hypothetical protein
MPKNVSPISRLPVAMASPIARHCLFSDQNRLGAPTPAAAESAKRAFDISAETAIRSFSEKADTQFGHSAEDPNALFNILTIQPHAYFFSLNDNL